MALHTFGLGGGSIIRAEGDAILVGPQSAGANPGPACFGLGGTALTPTDVWLLLGLLEPGEFLGGRRRLDPTAPGPAAAARPSGPRRRPLIEPSTRSARAARAPADGRGRPELTEAPEAERWLFSYGGGGGLLCAAAADALGAGNVAVFPHSSVFSAFGGGLLPIAHAYQAVAARAAGDTVARLADNARRDLRAEGVTDLDPSRRAGRGRRRTAGDRRLAALLDQAATNGADARGVCRLSVTVPRARCRHARGRRGRRRRRARDPHRGRPAAGAGGRRARRPGAPGVDGPAFLQAPDTTIFVPAGWTVAFTEQGYGVMSEEGARLMRRQITEGLDIDLDTERWHCRRCDHDLGDARANYKRGTLVLERDPREVHRPVVEGEYTFAPDPEWCRILEFICPGCATLLEVEYLPPGHPITHDIELDIDALEGRVMSSSLEIDIGGTFTDCYVRLGERETWCKTRTTPFDLSQGMSLAIAESAKRLGLPTRELLEEIEIIRYSTTLAMNKLIERKGPRLALIATEGFEDTLLIGRASQWSDGISFKEQRNIAAARKPEPLIPKELTVGVRERVDSSGAVLRELDEDHFLAQLDALVDQGVRGFVVALLWSFLNPVHERRIRELIEREYNETYLGRMPVFLSSEISPRKFEYTRTTMTVLNAYLHQSMYEELIGIGQQLRGDGYRKPLMMVHNTGGMASVFRSAAMHTFNGGPVAGLMGSAALGRGYGRKNVVLTDMGGTSFDIAMVVEGSTRFYQFAPTIDRWTVDATILDTRSIGSGGGSIAPVNPLLDNRLEVGPESAGSIPGPAAYDQGGREPTVTDADLVLGYLSPERFHGGQLKLNRRRAERAIRDRIAEPLGIEVDEAALLIKRIIDAKMGAEIYKETVLKGYDPREFVIFAAGGAGPAHCCGYAEAAAMREVVVFPFSSTFCAYGSSTMDVLHVYERSRHFTLLAAGPRRVAERLRRLQRHRGGAARGACATSPARGSTRSR